MLPRTTSIRAFFLLGGLSVVFFSLYSIFSHSERWANYVPHTSGPGKHPHPHHHLFDRPTLEGTSSSKKPKNWSPRDPYGPQVYGALYFNVSWDTFGPYPLDIRSEKLLKGTDYSQLEGNLYDHEYELALTEPEVCKEINMTTTVGITRPKYLITPIYRIDHAIRNTWLKEWVNSEEGVDVPKRWYYFGGSSIWLAEHQVHFYVSRVIFNLGGGPNHGKFSIAYAQLFDSDWNEVEMSLPVDTTPVDGSADNALYPTDPHASILFPRMLDIPFQLAGGNYYGPEDPRITLRRTPNGKEEPVLVFNMDLTVDGKRRRRMHLFFPFSGSLVRLFIAGYESKGVEKNWQIFTDPDAEVHTHIRFLYNLNKLEVLECEISTGSCVFIFGQPKSLGEVGVLLMRGGTDLWALPEPLRSQVHPSRTLWFGFARAQLKHCGCNNRMYRPNLFVLQLNKNTNEYLVLANGEFTDLGLDITPWPGGPGNDPLCEGMSVLIPNSISYWHVPNPKTYEDYMGVTVSSADANTQVIHIRGLLAYLARLPGIFTEPDTKPSGPLRFSNAVSCALISSEAYCHDLGRDEAKRERYKQRVKAFKKASEQFHARVDEAQRLEIALMRDQNLKIGHVWGDWPV